VEVLTGVVVVALVADTDEFEEVVPGLELSVGGVFFNGLPGDVACDDESLVLVDVVDGGVTLVVDLPWPETLIGVVVVGVVVVGAVVFVLVTVFVVVVGALVVVVGVVVIVVGVV